LLNETVDHWLPPIRDLFGNLISAGVTSHSARVILSPGELVGPASGENLANAKATVWLLNHPRQIAIGDTFGLPDGSELQAVRIETRVRPWGGSLHKVYLT
jgi:translation elongation factor EF-1alpha